MGVGGFALANAVWSGESGETASPAGRPEGPFFFSSVEQNGGTPEGGPGLLSDVPDGCTPTRDAYDWVTQGGMSEGDTLVPGDLQGVAVQSIDLDGYRNLIFRLLGAGEPMTHTQPVDSCRPLLVTMRADTSRVDLRLVSPSGVEYGPSTAQALGADLNVESDFLMMEIPTPEPGDWTVTLVAKGTWDGYVDGEMLLAQSRPDFEPYAVCEATVTGDTITLDASKSWDEDGTITDYFWELPDYSVLLEQTVFLDATVVFDATDYPDGDIYFPCIITDNDDEKTFSGVIVTLGEVATPATAASRTYSSLDNLGGQDPAPSATGSSDPTDSCPETRTAWNALQRRDIAYGTVLESTASGTVSEGSGGGTGSIKLQVVFTGTSSTPIEHTELLDSCRRLVTHVKHPGGSAGLYSLISPSGKVYSAGMPPEPGLDAGSTSESDDFRIREPEAGTWTLVFDPSAAVPGVTYAVVFMQNSPILYPPRPVCTVTVTGHALFADARGSAAGDAPIATYTWTFPDGVTATGATASHTLGSGWKGNQWVECAVTATDGQATRDGVSIVIE